MSVLPETRWLSFKRSMSGMEFKNAKAERIELLVGDGLLRCPDASGEFRHPILLQKLELEFYPEKRQPQFVFRKRDQQPELYMEFLRALPGVNSSQIARCADELKEAEFTPLGAEDTDGFLRRLIQGLFPSGGTMVGSNQVAGNQNVPDYRRGLSHLALMNPAQHQRKARRS